MCGRCQVLARRSVPTSVVDCVGVFVVCRHPIFVIRVAGLVVVCVDYVVACFQVSARESVLTGVVVMFVGVVVIVVLVMLVCGCPICVICVAVWWLCVLIMLCVLLFVVVGFRS